MIPPHSRPYLRLRRSAAFAVTLSVTFPAVASPSIPSDPVTLEVEMSLSIPDAEELSDWIHQEGAEALASLSPSPAHRGTIRVAVDGELYDYEVSITTTREGSTAEKTLTWTCDCTNDALLARIRTDVAAAASTLDDEPTPTAEPQAPRFPLRSKLGFGLLGGGAAVTILGALLTSVGDDTKAYRSAGIPTLVVGVAAITAGMTLIILEQRKPRLRSHRAQARAQARVVVFPFATPRGAHVGLTGTF